MDAKEVYTREEISSDEQLTQRILSTVKSIINNNDLSKADIKDQIVILKLAREMLIISGSKDLSDLYETIHEKIIACELICKNSSIDFSDIDLIAIKNNLQIDDALFPVLIEALITLQRKSQRKNIIQSLTYQPEQTMYP